ncbi:MAG: metallophosphoesterase [Erysipelotrichaceae bacterium]|nr:metallophosphoesterase [Erysipelotrichaceae bacterium]
MKKKMIYALLLAFAVWFLYHENTTLDTERHLLSFSSLPADFEGFRIAQVSDFHNCQNNKLRESIIRELRESHPDIIVITGDLIDSRRTDVDSAIAFVQAIKDIAPIYYVTGNHESRVQQYYTLQKKLNDLEIIVLHDAAVQLEKGSSHLNIIGIDDPDFSGVSTLMEETPDMIAWKINDLKERDGFNLVLCHRPELFETYVSCAADLVFCGHAHGGQIRLPFIGGLYAPHQGVFPSYTAGCYREENTTMVVSRGLGNSLAPFRIFDHPNLVIVEISTQDN